MKKKKKRKKSTLKKKCPHREYLRPDEVQAMIDAALQTGRHPTRDAAIILFLFRHGLRVAELAALKWLQIDLKKGYLDVRRLKNGNNSKQPLRGPQLRALRRLKREYPVTPYVFVSER